MAGKRFEVELPEEVLAGFGWEDGEVPDRMREAAVMELLRRDRISEAEAAIRMSREELQRELHQEFQRG